MNILIVDDSKPMLLMARKHLQEIGFSDDDILTSNRGREALDIISVTNIHLILLDWYMPDLSGIDLLKLMKKFPSRKIPVIMVTTEQKTKCIKQAIAVGVDDYLIKPIDIKKLADKIARIAAKYHFELPQPRKAAAHENLLEETGGDDCDIVF